MLEQYGYTIDTPVEELSDEALDAVFNGTPELLRIPAARMGRSDDYYADFGGVVKYIRQMADAEMTAASQRWAEQFNTTACVPNAKGRVSTERPCPINLAIRTLPNWPRWMWPN